MYTKDYVYKISDSETKKYRMYAQSIQPEEVGWDGSRDGLSKVGRVDVNSRPFD